MTFGVATLCWIEPTKPPATNPQVIDVPTERKKESKRIE
jgi:hypothetical protein